MDKDLKAFLKIKRQNPHYRAPDERVKDYKDVAIARPEEASKEQACRCMDCGTPFCHWACPLGNYIPEWNDLASQGQWEKALKLLEASNNFAEVTGRICPALCEYACVLDINDDAVTIRENELAIVEYGFKNNLIKPKPPLKRSGKNVAVIGSGPAGLCAAAELNRAGHNVVVFEKDDKPGGILRYGIPDFKLEKHLLDRRISIWEKEGLKFKLNTQVGKDYPVSKLKQEFDAVCIAIGSRKPRDLDVAGRNLKGIYFAMDFLTESNKAVAGAKGLDKEILDVEGKDVVVIGGGDTGSDCVGTAWRRQAKSVTQIELLPKPALDRTQEYLWPKYPRIFKQSTSQQEGGKFYWQVLTEKFSGAGEKVEKISCVKIEFCPQMKKISGSEFKIKADMVILALGFVHPQHCGLVEELGLSLDKRGNIKTGSDYMSSAKGVFACGDARRGQSLVVWAAMEGRQAAEAVDKWLK